MPVSKAASSRERRWATAAFERLFEDSPASRRLLAAVLYASFIPLAVAVTLEHGGRGRPAVFSVGTALLLVQFGYCVIVDGIGDVAAAVLTVVVPATYVVYVEAAPGADASLWPCLVLPVLWCAVFLQRSLVVTSVILNAAATVAGLSLQDAELLPLGIDGVTRIGVLAVAAVIVQGLVGHLRTARDSYRVAAETLQAGLLPDDLPDIEGFELSAVYRPGATGQRVGGDFYDVFQVKPATYVVMVGDVQGKDFAAARVTGLVRHTARALAFQHADPSAVLAATNAALRRARLDRFCTLTYARLELGDTAQILIANAGHPPPILRAGGGQTTFIEKHGPLLGVLDQPVFVTATCTLAADDAVVFYTDGITEARVDDTLFGQERLLEMLRRDAGTSDAPLADAIWRDVVAIAGLPQDDVAIVALKRRRGAGC